MLELIIFALFISVMKTDRTKNNTFNILILKIKKKTSEIQTTSVLKEKNNMKNRLQKKSKQGNFIRK